MASPVGLSPSRSWQALQAILRHVGPLLLSVCLVEGEFDEGPPPRTVLLSAGRGVETTASRVPKAVSTSTFSEVSGVSVDLRRVVDREVRGEWKWHEEDGDQG
ncbi:hypothetical protein PG994_011631 [Apiospora phragmitis]|uniref:Secreted protein n=1 Tax=Apiospora phragmitis TaxID=2905665 RepID=A0ABR1TTB8_9PEZI